MTPSQKLALTTAAHLHVAIEDSEQDSLELYCRLKAMAADSAEVQVISLGDEPIPSEYDYLTVQELVELIELDAKEFLDFSLRMLDAAHQGLMSAVEKPGFEMDASRWDFKAFADSHLHDAAAA
jgi:hypothetical protein